MELVASLRQGPSLQEPLELGTPWRRQSCHVALLALLALLVLLVLLVVSVEQRTCRKMA